MSRMITKPMTRTEACEILAIEESNDIEGKLVMDVRNLVVDFLTEVRDIVLKELTREGWIILSPVKNLLCQGVRNARFPSRSE